MSSNDASIVALVRGLVEAENTRNTAMAESILAPSFTAITRARGEEQNRSKLLEEMAQPKNPNIQRELDNQGFIIWKSEDLAVAKSLVTTQDKTDKQILPKRYRNIHVFERLEGQWRCVSWQVTELK